MVPISSRTGGARRLTAWRRAPISAAPGEKSLAWRSLATISVQPLSLRLVMANTKSAKKAARQIARRTVVNKSRRSRLRSAVRKVEEAIAAGDRRGALAAMAEAEPAIIRAAQKNVVHRNAAQRKVSRLTQRIAKLAK